MQLRENSLIVLKKRYFRKNEAGEPIETPEQMCSRVAHYIVQVEKQYGNPTEKELEDLELKFYAIMDNLEFLPNSPTLMNSGKGTGQLSGCFVLPIEDSIISIFDAVKATAQVHQSGGGTGYNFSKLRPKGSRVLTTDGVASGPVSFMRVFDASTEEIKQGGTRRGANMGILNVSHPDIYEFIKCKSDNTSFKNFNISVGVTEEFFKSVEDKKTWDLVDPKNGEIIKTVPAVDIFNTIIEMAWKTGDPGMVFLDRVNKSNPLPHLGDIESTNPCVTGDTLIGTTWGDIPIQDLVNKNPWVFCHDGEHLRTRRALKVWKTKENTEVWKLTVIDKKGKRYEIKATPNHKFYLIDGKTKVELKDLKPGDSLLPFNRSTHSGEYRLIQDLDGEWYHESHYVLAQFSPYPGEGYHAHHRDENPSRNDPSNLEWKTHSQHNSDHMLGRVNPIHELTELGLNPFQEEGFATKHNLETWKNLLVRQKRIEGIKEYHKNLSSKEKKDRNEKISESVNANKDIWVRNLQRTLDAKSKEDWEKTFSDPDWLALSDNQRLEILQSGQDPEFTEMLRKVEEEEGAREGNISLALVEYFNNLSDKERKELSERNSESARKSWDGPETRKKRIESITSSHRKRAEERKSPHEKKLSSIISDRLNLENHKVLGIEFVGYEDVYNMNVDEFHNYPVNGIISPNCGEQPLLSYESCNLGSINLARFVTPNNEINWERLSKVTKLAVRFLDDVIDANTFPLPEIEERTKLTRKIGLGVMGFADMLIMLGIPYDSDAALELAGKVMKYIQDIAHAKSKKLGELRGMCPADENLGRRNACITTIAPTGSLSIIAGCSSGIEPLPFISYKRNQVDEEMDEIHPLYLEMRAEKSEEELDRIFRTAHDIKPWWHLRMQSVFQEYVDNAVSKTINLPNIATKQDVQECYMLSYELGCKGLTTYRDGSKDQQVFIKADEDQDLQENLLREGPRPRPAVTFGITERMSLNCGDIYVTVNSDADGICEIFTTLGKSGGCTSAHLEAVSKITSKAVRSGVDLKTIIKALKGIRCPEVSWCGGKQIFSCEDAIGRVLEKRVGENDKVGNVKELGNPCPECNSIMVSEEGCWKCYGCGYSKC